MTVAMLPHELLAEDPAPDSAPCAVRLPRAEVDQAWQHLCAESCPHLRRTHEGDPMCTALDSAWGAPEPLHPSFDAEPIDGTPRAERCAPCLVAEELWGAP